MSGPEGSEINVDTTSPQIEPLTREEIKESHKVEIAHITRNLLSIKNPNHDQIVDVSRQIKNDESIPKLEDILQDVLKDACGNESLEDVVKNIREKHPTVNNADDVAYIARYYWDNPEKKVPERIVVLDDTFDKSDVDIMKKTMIFVDNKRRSDNKSVGYSFEDVFKDQLPDAYIKNMDGGIGSIDGIDNMMINMKKYPTNEDGPTYDFINLKANGTISIFNDTDIQVGFNGEGLLGPQSLNVSIHTLGDIIQSPGSKLGVQKVQCNNYIQYGGDIINPLPVHEGTIATSRITCEGEFVQHGGTKLEPPYVEIRAASIRNTQEDEESDASAIDAVRAEIAETSQIKPEDDLAEDAHLDIQAQPTSPEDLQEIVDYLGGDSLVTDIRKADGTTVHGYDFPNITETDDKRYTEFLTYAIAAGWSVQHSETIGQNRKVIIEKPAQK